MPQVAFPVGTSPLIFFFKFRFSYYFLYVKVLPVCVFMHMYVWYSQRSEGVRSPVKGLTIVSCFVGAGNLTKVLCY